MYKTVSSDAPPRKYATLPQFAGLEKGEADESVVQTNISPVGSKVRVQFDMATGAAESSSQALERFLNEKLASLSLSVLNDDVSSAYGVLGRAHPDVRSSTWRGSSKRRAWNGKRR